MAFLLMLAILPGALLIKRVYDIDEIEKEPRPLLARIIVGGALVAFPVVFAELVLTEVVSIVGSEGSFTYDLLENFIAVALAEEFGKYFITKINTWKNPEFNYRFDGVVYAVCASMGFAIFENILYVAEDWDLVTALMRAVLSIPGHCVFAIFMGYYYGEAKQLFNRGQLAASKAARKKAVLLPMLIHGFYDFALTRGGAMIAVFFVFVVVVYSRAFKNLKKYAAEDEAV